MSNENLPNIAFVGIGLMGLPMAARLVQAGYPLNAWNRTREKALPLAGYGAKVADTLADAVRTADIVITMLEAGPVVKRVVEAMLPDLRSGMLVIDMSSTKQSEACEVQRRHVRSRFWMHRYLAVLSVPRQERWRLWSAGSLMISDAPSHCSR